MNAGDADTHPGRDQPDTGPDTALADLAEGLARHVTRWSQALGAPAAAAQAAGRVARALSLARGAGHTCIRLDELGDLGDLDAPETANPVDAWPERLRRSAVVGSPAQPLACPLVLDDDGRLYLRRDFDAERRVALGIARAATAPAQPLGDAARAALRTRFPPPPLAPPDTAAGTTPAPVDWQAVAVALALRQRLVVVSGGPGTGKTTTVVALLACLLAQDSGHRAVLAAPTGKAAQRLSASLREAGAQLPPALRSRLPETAFTVHRLLGLRPGGGRPTHHAGHPLALDTLVVDEASMLDLSLAAQLIEAVPAHARIVLLGDMDQLAAVEGGAVFADLSADPRLSHAATLDLADALGVDPARLTPPAPRHAGVLRDSTVWLQRNYRFGGDSDIGRLAADIRRGDSAAALQRLRRRGDATLEWLVTAEAEAAHPGPRSGPPNGPRTSEQADAFQRIAEGYAPYLQAVRSAPGDVAAVAQAFERFRVLCAVREGARGVDAVNARMAQHAQRLDAGAAGSPWFIGRPVMVLRNDAPLGLFNGDIGYTLPGPDGAPVVRFPALAGDATGGWRSVAPARLPAHDTAFAMTVHKAQGSEFDALLLLLPMRASRVLSRELLYTAVTRARHRVTLAASAAVLETAIAAVTQRRSGLAARLREAVTPNV